MNMNTITSVISSQNTKEIITAKKVVIEIRGCNRNENVIECGKIQLVIDENSLTTTSDLKNELCHDFDIKISDDLISEIFDTIHSYKNSKTKKKTKEFDVDNFVKTHHKSESEHLAILTLKKCNENGNPQPDFAEFRSVAFDLIIDDGFSISTFNECLQNYA